MRRDMREEESAGNARKGEGAGAGEGEELRGRGGGAGSVELRGGERRRWCRPVGEEGGRERPRRGTSGSVGKRLSTKL